MERLLPSPPAAVLDVGGGPGTYAAPLARRGYRVHLVDPVPLHVEQAREVAGSAPAAGFTALAGDARHLDEPDQSQDAVLLFGLLYHLTGQADRRQALEEARRVPRPGGRLLAMAVCRFASLLDGLYAGWLDDPDFRPIVEQDLADGQHRNRDPAGRSSSLLPTSTPPTAWPARSARPASPARSSTGSRARAGPCARNGPTRRAASTPCSRPRPPRPSPRSSASASTSSPPPPNRRRGQEPPPPRRELDTAHWERQMRAFWPDSDVWSCRAVHRSVGPAGPLTMRESRRGLYCPCQCGRRFSVKAWVPSRWSSVVLRMLCPNRSSRRPVSLSTSVHVLSTTLAMPSASGAYSAI